MTTAVIYARISVTLEESVSVERQLESATAYAAARGWTVAGSFVDDGVSASRNRPDDRKGWAALLASPTAYDKVIIWKVDRLARRVLDFLNADQALQDRGAGIVAVEDPVDMTTPQGRAFATMLAVFGEMEAAAISARVKAARTHLLRSGRVVGGTVPYGWRSVANPDGPGMVLAKDRDRIGYVDTMVARTLQGHSIYSTVQHLNRLGAPTRNGRPWAYTTVENILRHPILAGMTPFNPGNDTKKRGREVLRDADGLPVVDESVALMSPGEWRAMVKALDDRNDGRAKPRAMRSKTSALLSGLVWCGEHLDDDGNPTRMWRGTSSGRHAYSCPVCHQTVSGLDDHVVERFLTTMGDTTRWTRVVEVEEGGAEELPEIEHALADLSEQLARTDDDAEADRLGESIRRLRARRREARSAAPVVVQREVGSPTTFREAWERALDDAERRAVLDDAIDTAWVVRGKVGRYFDPARLVVEWRTEPTVWPSDADVAAHEAR
ncbi:recombinase family protein [Arsenicicoccus cauae]|uniref:recombinase family protein n=1 Tax=Arsenicicoccus cauae TaxID=2663847 RepID=UPI00370D8529